MSHEQESELQTAQRAARVVFLSYSDDESAADLRARFRAEWVKLFGDNSMTIVPPWLGRVLNEGGHSKAPQMFVTAAYLARCDPVLPLSGDGAKSFEALMADSCRTVDKMIRGKS